MANREPNSNDKWNGGRPPYMRFAGAGLELAGSTLVLAYLGHLVDGWIGWQQPWGMVAGALLGMSAGMYRLYRLTNTLQ